MTALVFGTVLPWLLLAVGTWVGFQLVRQNGRLLLRLEAIDKRLALRGDDQPKKERGLRIGTVAPAFELPDLAGERHKLSDFRGKDLLLIFFNPKCGFCTKMADDLAALPLDGENGHAVPVMVTTGDLQANRKLVELYRIRGVVLRQEEMEVASQFHAGGTPMGYRIDKEGRIASELIMGAEELLKLAERATDKVPTNRNGSDASANGSAKHGEKDYRSLTASRLNRKGLKAGEAAPDFRLPRIDGGELSLADYRGRRVLLVFSDPHCGPCAELATQLQELHVQQPDLSVFVISRGGVEENRDKASALGLTYPIVLQKNWDVSLKYAMFATPIGYLIDEQGILLSDVTVGVGPILALGDEPAAAGVPASAGALEFRL